MAKKKRKRRKPPPAISGVVIRKHPLRTFLGFHVELAKLETEEYGRVRFCLAIDGACFWLCVGEDIYSISTQDLGNAALEAVLTEKGS